jgi:hypothetical protein
MPANSKNHQLLKHRNPSSSLFPAFLETRSIQNHAHLELKIESAISAKMQLAGFAAAYNGAVGPFINRRRAPGDLS